METSEAYLERKRDEIRLLNNSLTTPLTLKDPRSPSEFVRQKFQLTAALKAEHVLGDWTATETAWASAQHRSGPFEFTYDYQRADLDVRGPSFYELNGTQETVYTGSGMAAIAALLFALARLIDHADVVLPPGSYGETQELIEGYARHLTLTTRDRPLAETSALGSLCRIMWIDSSSPDSSFEAEIRRGNPPFDLVIFDTTCLCASSGRVRRMAEWAERENLPLVLVRSHTKLDSLGAEYGRLGSAVFICDKSGCWAPKSRFENLPSEMRNALRLFGGAPLPAHFPPYVGTTAYRELTRKRMAAIIRNSRRSSRYLATSLPGLTAELRFSHGLYVTLQGGRPLSESTARKAAAAMSDDLGRAGLPIRHAGSFGFDFAATEWFREPATGRYFVRISVPDLHTALWDDLTRAIAKWWMAHEGKQVEA